MVRRKDILAMSVAQAILGACGRVIDASLENTGEDTGLTGDGGVRLTGDGTGNAALNVDFVPDAEVLALALRWHSDAIPEGGDLPIGHAFRLRLDGKDIAPGSRADVPDKATAIPDREVPEGGLTLDLAALFGLVPGRPTSLRLSLADDAETTPELLFFSESANAPKSGNYVAVDDATTITRVGATTLNLTANDIGPGKSLIYITEINGTPLEPGESVTLAGGQVVTLLDDGTVSIVSNGSFDSFSFEYTAAYGKGNAQQIDTASVSVDTVPCFVSGTLIRTLGGERPVETLAVGDLIHTRDDGLQPIRWIGRRRVAAVGPFAPIEIAANSLGDHAALRVSPLHRVLQRNGAAELLYGSAEVLAHARDLLGLPGVTRVEGGQVEYVHILFDRHHIVWSAGLETESFLPGPQTKHCFEARMVAEITAIFPELDPATGTGYGPTARPALKSREARLLVA